MRVTAGWSGGEHRVLASTVVDAGNFGRVVVVLSCSVIG